MNDNEGVNQAGRHASGRHSDADGPLDEDAAACISGAGARGSRSSGGGRGDRDGGGEVGS